MMVTPAPNGYHRRRRFSCPSAVLPEALPTVCENNTLVIPGSIGKGRRKASLTGESDRPDLSEFTLPGLAEEDTSSDEKEFRPRAHSAGLKNLMKFRSRNKSGDKDKEKTHTDNNSNTTGIRGFLDNLSLRQRSKSDATSLKQAQSNMLRKKHASGPHPVQHANTVDLGSTGDLEPIPRGRSTSWGARDRLRMQRVEKDLRLSAGKPAQQDTIMSQLISGNGITNRQNGVHHQDSDQSMHSDAAGEHHYTGQALIWEDTSMEDGQGDCQSYLDRMQIEDIEVNDPLVFNKFMRAHRCYDVVPISSKLVVFDTTLSVKKAFYALVYNCVRAAPLWDNNRQNFIGMLTITDFIKILTKYYKSPNAPVFQEKMKELEEHQISSWRKELKSWYKPFVSISPESSVCEAVRKLTNNKVHRLPVVDPVSGNAVFIITHKRILKFIHLYMKNIPKPSYMNESLQKLKLGTYHDIAKVKENTRVIDALKMFVDRRVSALPIVDDRDKVTDIYAKFDVLNLAADKSYGDLDVSIKTAISYHRTAHERVLSCQASHSLNEVIEKIVKHGVHRLIVTSESEQLIGIISLSDILKFLLQEDDCVKQIASATTLTNITGTPLPTKQPIAQAT